MLKLFIAYIQNGLIYFSQRFIVRKRFDNAEKNYFTLKIFISDKKSNGTPNAAKFVSFI